VTFTPNFRVSQGTSSAKDAGGFSNYGDYTQAAFQSHLFYLAWSDNSDSTSTNPDGKLHQMDLYTALIREWPPAGQAAADPGRCGGPGPSAGVMVRRLAEG
jgi:hypothetical protein